MSGTNLLVLGGTQAAVDTSVYIEDVFSTWLYTGNGSTQTITNGIDLSTKGGLVWIKSRSNALDNAIYDTARGNTKVLFSNATVGDSGYATTLTAFNSNGFSVDKPATGSAVGVTNTNAYTYVSWTFRKQPKFFDVVTWTGNGDNYRTISHNLKSTPGCVIVKSTSASGAWAVWHRSVNPNNLILNSTSAAISGQYSIQDVTSSNFGVANSSFYGFPQSIPVNDNGATYVAYLFAHDAGGFGTAGTDNVISCGSFTSASGGSATLTLNYEPQWILFKRTDSTGDWFMFDNMRGMFAKASLGTSLYSNTNGAEVSAATRAPFVTSTGLTWDGSTNTLDASATYIYIAIRRGPMKTPTSGTSVFSPQTATGYQSPNIVTDSVMFGVRAGASYSPALYSRLQGSLPYLLTSSTDAEATGSSIGFDSNNGVNLSIPANWITYYFKRAPGFFDVVCYTGTGTATTVTHNLGVAPELMIIKQRNSARNWAVYNATLGNTKNLLLNTTDAENTLGSVLWNNTTPTSSVFTIGTSVAVNESASTYVAYLFATVAGVSKVGSYTGTGTTKQVDCGFTNGSRFVLIKRTDSTGDWYVWDSARGIVSGNDPYLLLNSTAAEVTNTDYVDTYSAGFELSSTAPAGLNANGGSYIFLAIA